MIQSIGIAAAALGAVILFSAVRNESPIDVVVSTFDNRPIRPFGAGGWVK